MNALLVSNTQVNHADISTHVTGTNRAFQNPAIVQFLSPFTRCGAPRLRFRDCNAGEIIAYIDDYKLLMIATLMVIPLLQRVSEAAFQARRRRGGPG